MPLRIIIDGYNLIGIYHRDLQKQREFLIKKLIRYSELKKHQIILVFDGYKSGYPERKVFNHGNLKIVYTGQGETADEFIYSFLRVIKNEWVVVSSDRSIQKEAWSKNAIPLNSEDFERIMEGSIREENKSPESEKEINQKEYYDKTEKNTKKGNPNQLSRKEKVLLRIMEKL